LACAEEETAEEAAECVVRSEDAEPDAGADSVAVDGGSLDGGSGCAEDGEEDDGAEDDGLSDDGEVEVDGHGLPDAEFLSPGEEHGEGEPETLTDGDGLTGGWVFLSWCTLSPRCRAIHSLLSGSKMTNTLMTVVEGATTTTFCERYDGHESPVGLGVPCCGTGASSGLPHAQRTRGTPRASTSTAVPAWRTAW
jgi:hypothetical protein